MDEVLAAFLVYVTIVNWKFLVGSVSSKASFFPLGEICFTIAVKILHNASGAGRVRHCLLL
jgi:hypothetical protein